MRKKDLMAGLFDIRKQITRQRQRMSERPRTRSFEDQRITNQYHVVARLEDADFLSRQTFTFSYLTPLPRFWFYIFSSIADAPLSQSIAGFLVDVCSTLVLLCSYFFLLVSSSFISVSVRVSRKNSTRLPFSQLLWNIGIPVADWPLTPQYCIVGSRL